MPACRRPPSALTSPAPFDTADMLLRHILGYVPSLVVPVLASFATVFLYTRLLTPAEYGHYSLAITAMMLLVSVFFYWLQVSLPRLMPHAIKAGRTREFQSTVHVAYAAVCAAILLLAPVVFAFVPEGWRAVAWFAVPLALVRALLTMNQSFHRSRLDFRRFNLIECGQALLSLAIGLALVGLWHLGYVGAAAGTLAGMTLMILVDLRTLLATRWRDVRRDQFDEIVRFGAPLVLSFGIAFLVSNSDRFLIAHYRDAAEVGIYSAGYMVMDRITVNLFMLIAGAAFPLLIHRFEHDGPEGAREQFHLNGVAFLMVGLPACTALILLSQDIARVFIGAAFREGAARVMPWIAGAALLNALSTHYFSHAFQVAKKPRMLVYTLAPVALVNLGLNVLLIPTWGYMGAAWAATATYALMLVLMAWFGLRSFPFPLPWMQALQIGTAVLPMAAVLLWVPLPSTAVGLIGKAVLGTAVYGLSILALNVMDARARAHEILARVFSPRPRSELLALRPEPEASADASPLPDLDRGA